VQLYYIRAIIVLFILLSSFPVYSSDNSFYCYDLYDEYREIKYWAKRSVSISDYNFNSGDSIYLGLSYKDDKKHVENTNKEIIDHFNIEFERLICVFRSK